MRSPQPLRNGEHPSPLPHPNLPSPQFHSTVSAKKLRRFALLVLLFRVVTFCFSLASAIFMLTNSRGSSSPRWYNFDAYRFVFAANALVAVYSLFEMVASVWEFSGGVTLLPQVLQLWFDFAHDQVFAYLLLSAGSAGTAQARDLKGSDTCTVAEAFCLQSDIAIALGFVGFLFLGFSALLSGYRVVCFIITGFRFYL